MRVDARSNWYPPCRISCEGCIARNCSIPSQDEKLFFISRFFRPLAGQQHCTPGNALNGVTSSDGGNRGTSSCSRAEKRSWRKSLERKPSLASVFIVIVIIGHEGEHLTRIGKKRSQCLEVMEGTELQFLTLLLSRIEKMKTMSSMRRFDGSGAESIL